MKIKGRGILVLCLVLFGGFAFYDYFNDKSQAAKNIEEARLVTVNFEQIDDVRIEKGESKVFLKRTVDGWQMEEPIKDTADNDAADDLVKSSFTERIIEVAKEGPNVDWKVYGLDAPLGVITFKTTDGKENRFEISAKKNFEENVFARRNGEDKVLVINSIWQDRINKPAIEFRDRRFLRHKIASVDEIKLKNSKGLLHLSRVDGKWQVHGQAGFILDQNLVRSLLTSIADAKGAEILADPKKGPALKSLFTLDLVMDKNKWNAQVGQADGKGIYASVSDPAQLMKLEPGALDNLISMTAENLKEKPPEKTQFDKNPGEQKEN